MRPALSLFDSLLGLTTSVQKPLIAYGDLGYDRRLLPVAVCYDRSDETPITQKPGTGEAKMDHSGSNRTKPNTDSDSANMNRDSEDRSGINKHMQRDHHPETLDERLARIKAEIDAGVYETPEKLEIAIDRMMGIITE